MKISCIGDSLTEGDYGVRGKCGIANVHHLNYPYYLSLMLSAEVQNLGKCGYRASTVFDRWEQHHFCVAGSDFVLIMLGANGGHTREGNSADDQAYRNLVSRCRREAPQAKIVLITTPHVTVDPALSNCGYAPQVEQAVLFTRAYAAQEAFPLIDLAAYDVFSDENEDVLQPNDGLHYAAFGYYLMAGFIARELKRLFPDAVTLHPVAFSRPVSVSTFRLQGRFGDEKALELAARAGADGVDFNLLGEDENDSSSVYAQPIEAVKEYYAHLRKKADELNLRIFQTHGRITGFVNDLSKDQALLKNAEKDLVATAALGAPVCVFHTATTHLLGVLPAETMHRLNDEMFLALLPLAEKYQVQIATETFGDAPSRGVIDFFGRDEEFVRAFERVRAQSLYGDRLTVCVDTGHTNKAMRFGFCTPGDMIRKLNGAVTVLHLHDNDSFTDQHNIPTRGCIDWNDVFNALDGIGYTGAYNAEVALGHDGPDTMVDELLQTVQTMHALLDDRYGRFLP